MLGIGWVFVFCISPLVFSLIFGYPSFLCWKRNGFKQYDISELAYYQKKLEAVETLLKRGDNPSLKTEKLSGTKKVKYSYSHGQVPDSKERKNYDYRAIKTRQGYTKKRTIKKI